MTWRTLFPLGKRRADHRVLVKQQAQGVWPVRTATVIPDNERWLHAARTQAELKKALDWATAHPASDEDTQASLTRLGRGQ